MIILSLPKSFPNAKFWDWAKCKALADDKFKVTKTIISVFYRVESIVEKRGNAGKQCFLLFPQCFQKASSLESLKVGIVC